MSKPKYTDEDLRLILFNLQRVMCVDFIIPPDLKEYEYRKYDSVKLVDGLNTCVHYLIGEAAHAASHLKLEKRQELIPEVFIQPNIHCTIRHYSNSK